MSKHNYNKLANIEAALKILRQYNQYVIFPVSEEAFSDPLLEEYFESDLDAPIEAKVEKILSAAAVMTVYDNPNIPDSKKEAIAKKNAREIREAMRIAKLEYHAYIKGTVTVIGYNKRRKAIPLVSKAARIKQLKKLGKYMALRELATVLIDPAAGGTVMVGRFVWKLMPEKTRKALVEIGREVKEDALNVVMNCCDYIKSTRVGKAVERAVEKVKPIVNKVTTAAKKTAKKAKDKIKALFPSIF